MDMKILIADDDPDILLVLRSTVSSMGHENKAFHSGNEAISEIAIHPDEYDCALLDYNMEGLDGIRTADILKRISKGLPVIMMSGDVHVEERAKEKCVEIDFFIQKPFDAGELRDAINRFLDPEDFNRKGDRT